MSREEIIEKFLTKIEAKTLKQEEEINELTETAETYRYLNDLVEVIETSKTAFAEGVVELKKKQLEQFKNKLKKAGVLDFEVDVLLDEVNNLYNLEESKLLDNPDVKEQKDKSIKIIEEVEEKMKNYLSEIDYRSVEKKRKELLQKEEKNIALGSKFNGNHLESMIDNIDFFYSSMKNEGLTEEEIYVMAEMLVEENNKQYRKELEENKEIKYAEESLYIDEEDKEAEDDISKILFPKPKIEVLEDEEEFDKSLEEMLQEKEEEEDDVVDFENDKLSNKELIKLYLGKTPEKIKPEDEQELLIKAKSGDMEAKNRLIEAYQYLVVTTAKSNRNKGLDMDELIQEGNVGLLKAIDKCDVEKITTFSAYAIHWIRETIRHAVLSKARQIRLPEHADRDIVSLDEFVDEDTQLKDVIVDPENKEDHYLYEKYTDGLRRALQEDILTDREKDILHRYFGFNGTSETLEEIAKDYNISRERVRQIKNKALLKLRYGDISIRSTKSKTAPFEHPRDYDVADMLKNAEEERIKEIEYLEDEKKL